MQCHAVSAITEMTEASLNVETRGSGPPIVMLHGWGLHSGIWAGLADRLSDRFTLHLVDLPGHGLNRDTELPLRMETVLKDLDRLPPAGWLGWSLGGLVAMQAAIRYPQRVTWLGLVAATPSFIARPHWPHGMDEAVFNAFADDLETDHGRTLERFLALEVHGARDARTHLRRLQEIASSRPGPRLTALRQGLDVLVETDLVGELDRITCPAAVIGGRRDRLVSPSAIEATAAAVQHADAHLIPGAGHAPHLGNREVVEDIITALHMGAA